MRALLCTALLTLAIAFPVYAVEEVYADDIVNLLQQGGYVIYVRHAATNHSQKDKDRENPENCKTQRNLSEEGVKQAKAIGVGFREKSIPVGKVNSSPYCRTRHTASLAFGNVELNPDLGFSISMSREDTDRLSETLIKMLSEQPKAGTNTVIVSHSSNLKDAAGVWPKPEGAMAIFRPDRYEKSGFKFIGMIKPSYWLALENK